MATSGGIQDHDPRAFGKRRRPFRPAPHKGPPARSAACQPAASPPSRRRFAADPRKARVRACRSFPRKFRRGRTCATSAQSCSRPPAGRRRAATSAAGPAPRARHRTGHARPRRCRARPRVRPIGQQLRLGPHDRRAFPLDRQAGLRLMPGHEVGMAFDERAAIDETGARAGVETGFRRPALRQHDVVGVECDMPIIDARDIDLRHRDAVDERGNRNQRALERNGVSRRKPEVAARQCLAEGPGGHPHRTDFDRIGMARDLDAAMADPHDRPRAAPAVMATSPTARPSTATSPRCAASRSWSHGRNKGTSPP